MSFLNSPYSAKQTRTILKRIRRLEKGTLRGAVAAHALRDWNLDPRLMFEHFAYNGCSFRLLDGLDHSVFFETYYDDIEELREDGENPVFIYGDLRTHFALFAFDEAAIRMARDDLGFTV